MRLFSKVLFVGRSKEATTGSNGNTAESQQSKAHFLSLSAEVMGGEHCWFDSCQETMELSSDAGIICGQKTHSKLS